MGLLLQIPEFSWFSLDLISMSHDPSAPAVPFFLPSSGSSVTLAWCTGPSLSHDLNLQTPSFSIPGAELLPALLDSNLLTCLLQREHAQAGSVEPTTKHTENIQAKSEIVSLGPKTCILITSGLPRLHMYPLISSSRLPAHQAGLHHSHLLPRLSLSSFLSIQSLYQGLAQVTPSP